MSLNLPKVLYGITLGAGLLPKSASILPARG